MIPEIWSTRQNVFHFGPFLPFYTPVCPLSPSPPLPNSPENQNFEKMKKHVEISSFYTSVTKTMILCYVAPEIWHATHVIVIFYFGLFFTLLQPPPPPPPPPCSPKNQNFKKKMKKTPGDITILNMCTTNYD